MADIPRIKILAATLRMGEMTVFGRKLFNPDINKLRQQKSVIKRASTNCRDLESMLITKTILFIEYGFFLSLEVNCRFAITDSTIHSTIIG